MSRIANFTTELSRLPFVGKHLIAKVSQDALRETYTKTKVRKTLGGLALVGTFVAGHAVQAYIGMSEFYIDASLFDAGDDSMLRRAEASYDVAYAVTNVAVATAQSYIGYRMVKNLGRSLRKGLRVEPFEAGIYTEPSVKGGCEPYEVSIDNLPPPPKNAYPAYNVGIDMDLAAVAALEARERKSREISRDGIITLGAQTIFYASWTSY